MKLGGSLYCCQRGLNLWFIPAYTPVTLCKTYSYFADLKYFGRDIMTLFHIEISKYINLYFIRIVYMITNIELLVCLTNHIWNNNYNIYLEMFDVTQFIYHCYWYTSHSCVFIRYKLRHPSLLKNLSLFWLFLPYWLGPLYRPRITLANDIHP